MQRVKIKTTSPTTADLFIGDTKIENCHEFSFIHRAGNLAELTLYTFNNMEIDEDADIIIDKSPRWISVTERLPKEEDYRSCHEASDGAVWYQTLDGEIGLGWYYASAESWRNLGEYKVDNVISWMPIPDPTRGYS